MDGKPIKSAERTLLLFELFAAEQRRMTVSEISVGMGMPQSSTSVLLKSLASLGYLDYNRKLRSYYPTLRIALLGTWIRRRHRRSSRIPRLLARIAGVTGESAVLALRNGIYAQYVLAQQGNDPLRLHVESGMRRPLACCASGWALLSFDRNEEIGRIIRRTQAEAPKELWRNTAQNAVEQVQLVRKRGYAFSNGETTRGAGAISILLPALPDQTPLAAGVGGPIERILEKQDLILETLHDLAKDISSQEVNDLLDTPEEVGGA